MSETVTKNGLEGPEAAGPVDPHVADAAERWKIYTFVFVALFVLTLVEVFIYDIIPEKAPAVAALVALMLAKAALVVMYYMHLRWESRVLRWIVLIPFGAAIFFVFIVWFF